MCEPGAINADAKNERDGIVDKGNDFQKVAMALAYTRAMAACRTRVKKELSIVASEGFGTLYSRVDSYKGVVEAQVMIGNYLSMNDECMDVLACDISSSAWWYSPPPKDRALQKMKKNSGAC